MRHRTKVILSSLLLLSSYSYSNSYIDDLLVSLSDDLNKYEKIATDTNHNEHYQPYIISILQGKTLEKLGISSLEDALKLIPGIDIANDNLNFKSPIFRGSNPKVYGQSKLLIDGVLVNNVFTEGYVEYLKMPIEMINRIEVIRGPGSQSNGINAYAGSINIITYSNCDDQKDLLFGKVGSNSYRSGGFRKYYKKGKFSFFSDFYYQEDDNSLSTGKNVLATGIFNKKTPWYVLNNSSLAVASEAPLWLDNYSLGLSLSYDAYSLKGRINQYKQGAAYGAQNVQAQKSDSVEMPNHYLEVAFDKTIEDFQVNSKIGYKRDGLENSSKMLPDGMELPKWSNPKQSVVYKNGAYLDMKSEQSTLYHSTFLTYNGLSQHKIKTGYYLSLVKIEDIQTKMTNRDTGIGLVDYINIPPFIDKNEKRDTQVLSIEDKYQYSQNLQLLYSINYEKNSHIDAVLNPKLSFIYQGSHEDIYKFSYSKSHRTPSWQEVFTINNSAKSGNVDLKAEKVDAYEGAYIKHFSNDSYVQANLYYLINKNQISYAKQEREYVNSTKDNTLYGAEVEYKGSITSKDNLYINLSYTNGENSTDGTLSYVSNFLFKGYYIYNILENLSLSTILKYSSKKGRVDIDPRDSLDGYTEVDSALVYKNYAHEYDITLSVKNMFDKDGRYPSTPFTYVDDYPKDGRTFLLTLKKEF